MFPELLCYWVEVRPSQLNHRLEVYLNSIIEIGSIGQKPDDYLIIWSTIDKKIIKEFYERYTNIRLLIITQFKIWFKILNNK